VSKELNYCSLCGRNEEQARYLNPRGRGFICDECDGIHAGVFEDIDNRIRQRERDPSVNDAYRQYEVELENQSALRKQFRTSVADPKDPNAPKASGNEMGHGMRAHPLLGDKVQFNGMNEANPLPINDPEQQEKYQEYQLRLAAEKQYEAQYQATSTPTMKPNG